MERTELESAETSHTAKKKDKEEKERGFLGKPKIKQKTDCSVRELHMLHEGTDKKTAEDHNRCIIAEGYGKALGYAVKCP